MQNQTITTQQQLILTPKAADASGNPTSLPGTPVLTLMDDYFNVANFDKGVITITSNADGTFALQPKAAGSQNVQATLNSLPPVRFNVQVTAVQTGPGPAATFDFDVTITPLS